MPELPNASDGVARPGRPTRRWLLLATTPAALARRRRRIARLVEAGDTVVILHRGRLDRGSLDGAVAVHELPTDPRPGGRARRILGRLPFRRRRPPAGEQLETELRRADEVLLLDQGAGTLLRSAGPGHPARIWPPDQVDEMLHERHHLGMLQQRLETLSALPPGATRPTHRVRVAIRALLDRELLLRPSVDGRATLVDLARRAYLRGDVSSGDLLADGLRIYRPVWGEDPAHRLALRAGRLQAVVLGSAGPVEMAPVVDELLGAADTALEEGDLPRCASLTTDALNLLFHRVLHTAAASSPLVDDPTAYLATWRSSRVAALLAQSSGPRPDRSGGKDPSRPPHVVLLPGSYPHHAAPLVRAIGTTEARLSVSEAQGGMVSGMVLRRDLVELRLASALGLVDPARAMKDRGGGPAELATRLAEANVVAVDWADQGAVCATMVAHPQARIVIRVHSVDALSAPLQLLDWSRVDEVVYVSEHIAEVVAAVTPASRSAGRHIVHNSVDPSRFRMEQEPGASRTLGMVAWGRWVKDPLMALDIFALLRRRDPAWRLRLIGEGLSDSSTGQGAGYAAEVRRRMEEPDVRGAIDHVGQTSQVSDQLARVGFVLSTSFRESCPLGVLEGVAAGAVPVVREWPVFARLQGASRIFPEKFVFTTAAEAADLIWSLRDPDDRASAAAEARSALEARVFDHDAVMRRLGRIVVGDEDS